MATKPPTLAEVAQNRNAVKLARDQRIIQSWLPPATATGESTVTTQETYDNDQDFSGMMDELGGIGSKRKLADEDDILGGLKRTKVARDDKLLERLIGRKGAEAKKKESLHVASKPKAVIVKPVRTVEESDDEEEGGRAGAFKSKRRKEVAVEREPIAEPDEEGSADEETRAASMAKTAAAPVITNPTKSKTTSYLDEMLSQRASKKKKKKKGKKKDVVPID
ncbi:hypothetical protein LTR78_000865 [Recurvomyces mirabilis]|uniref:Uncharacterized protein n=1 Tax=Recurvomyces mirabilis TaxID=574656 RepID=A0AAE0WWH6_9PEZI|nr:hypothetical protein LTR78_000865 [Recurvomyces mirabilis]KAK5158835.1 hypothetical protein LTS14_002943 [Recurvomyces mirabilis]